MIAAPLRIAVQLLTRLPAGAPAEPEAGDMGKAVVYYPVVGLLIGLVLALAGAVLDSGGPPLVGAALVVVIWMGLTGLLHVDGLADSADAWLGGQGDSERTLTILKEPTVGPAGVALVAGVLLVKLGAVAALLGAGSVLVAVPVLARAGTIWLLLTTSYIREEGMGALAARNLPRAPGYAAVTIAVLFGLFLTGVTGFAALVAGGIALVFLRWLMQQRIGGVTGDTLGAAIEVTEAALLAAFAYALV